MRVKKGTIKDEEVRVPGRAQSTGDLTLEEEVNLDLSQEPTPMPTAPILPTLPHPPPASPQVEKEK